MLPKIGGCFFAVEQTSPKWKRTCFLLDERKYLHSLAKLYNYDSKTAFAIWENFLAMIMKVGNDVVCMLKDFMAQFRNGSVVCMVHGIKMQQNGHTG